jgi:hypothetical protein
VPLQSIARIARTAKIAKIEGREMAGFKPQPKAPECKFSPMAWFDMVFLDNSTGFQSW